MDTHPVLQGYVAHLRAELKHVNTPPAAARAEPAADAKLETVWARHPHQVREAQRLRWRVFASEMGARIVAPPGTPAGLDADAFDAHCEHLLVQTVETDDAPAQVVGTYRVLTPTAAARGGGLYSDKEFDLSRLAPLRPRIAELGRSCVDPRFRTGGAILMLWAALADFMQRNGLDLTVGCASISMSDGGHTAASLWNKLRRSHMAPDELAARPYLPLPVEHLNGDLEVEPPALIKGYLKCGGQVLGAPALDPDFQTADLPMIMNLAHLPPAYRRRFLRG